MPVNPSIKPDLLNHPTERANRLNDPQFANQQGYFPYNLTHSEFISPLFGKVTPSMDLSTVPGDRIVVHNNCKTILNQINGNMLSTVNQYVDNFFVSLRSVFPMHYEKLIPNPTKGDDLPNSALPQVPLLWYFNELLALDHSVTVTRTHNEITFNIREVYEHLIDYLSRYSRSDATISYPVGYYLGRLLLLSTIVSRGQLLDYLGIAFDDFVTSSQVSSVLQSRIDNFQRSLHSVTSNVLSVKISADSDIISLEGSNVRTVYNAGDDLSVYRDAIDSVFESGRLPFFSLDPGHSAFSNFIESTTSLVNLLASIFDYTYDKSTFISVIDSSSSPFGQGDFINIGKVLAYQQTVAHYYSNDSVDNVFTSELYMQLLRGVMFPANSDGFTSEPVFNYNGVNMEYDYISSGAFFSSLIRESVGLANRQMIYATLMFLLRRSLRYGDYFATARPNMLAVGQLSINVENGAVSPIDVTKNLLLQRYANAANYIGSGFPQYYASMYGVVPSDLGCAPRFLSHRKIELQSQITNNTADNQGAQTTNLAGYSDNNAFDVYIDDLGFIISLVTFDVLPVYKSGIDSTTRFADRFDFFNPMLQGIGDQPIRSSELLGYPALYSDIFGYTMRNAEYKYKLSKAHGAFVNSLPGFLIAYPLNAYVSRNRFDLNISPDFIRDKPVYLDPVVPQMTGISPGEYYHFACSVVNQVLCARKIQATPPVLF